MDIFEEFRIRILSELDSLAASGWMQKEYMPANISVERPKIDSHGELAANAAIVAAKGSGRKPREIADALARALTNDSRVKSVEIAGPGFLNIRLLPSVWLENLRKVIAQGKNYGRSTHGADKTVLLEFVSANPTGPLHVGHARGAVFGDSLGRLLEFVGFAVTREYYLNDGGSQVDTLARSVYRRYLEVNGLPMTFGEGEYRGQYLIAVGESLKKMYGTGLVDKPESEWLPTIRNFAIQAMVDLIHSDLQLLGIQMDAFFSEVSLYESGRIERAISELAARNLIYEGTLPPPKGGDSTDWKPRQQTLFRSTAHGDDVDRPIQKSDGTWTYFAPDIAYHYDKVERGYDELINVFGADHSGYVKRIRAVVSAFSDGQMPFDIKLTQLVRVKRGGEAQKMSKRAGEFVQLSETVEAVGPDVTRFVMLTRKNDAQLDFDFDKVREQSKENPVFYVQYAHARVCSAIRKVKELGLNASDEDLREADLTKLTDPRQLDLIRKVAEWPRVVTYAAANHEPHRIAFYLSEIAADFHALWTLGNREPHMRIIQEADPNGTIARLALARAVALVIASGLGILGVKPMNEMRG